MVAGHHNCTFAGRAAAQSNSMFYKVTMDPGVVNTEPWLLGGNSGLGSDELPVITFSTAKQYITLVYVCFGVFKDT